MVVIAATVLTVDGKGTSPSHALFPSCWLRFVSSCNILLRYNAIFPVAVALVRGFVRFYFCVLRWMKFSPFPLCFSCSPRLEMCC